ncbi:hypothetical protein [Rudaeicoccus suwonensis]|uniref:Uncharacterized protein n=1 Tax=Rudaeicoccus suwonensis TaxID=657409 RepID=A0A561E0U8_9MICO|nr:hypothetical protein [Rudaeicoccus suwonensis]TWE09229.1 hypothetical protein BKA23_2929 [Rudaeicoccus suwonensis]
MTMHQLTYAIVDRPGRAGAGGWGVVATTPGVPHDVEQSLIDGRCVALPSYVSQFMSDAELAARPVRFRVVPWFEGLMMWHAVEAGTDATNRPGNVFTHAAAVLPAGSARPLDWAFSTDWLRPFGARDVALAELPAAISLPPLQLPFLAWLHSAGGPDAAQVGQVVGQSMAAITNGMRVALVVPDSQTATGWLDLLAWLLPAEAARHLRWSTAEDPASLPTVAESGYDVVSVTRADHVRVLAPDWFVTVETQPASESGHPSWQQGLAEEISEWSATADELLAMDPAPLRELFDRRDGAAMRFWPDDVRGQSRNALHLLRGDVTAHDADPQPTASGDHGVIAFTPKQPRSIRMPEPDAVSAPIVTEPPAAGWNLTSQPVQMEADRDSAPAIPAIPTAAYDMSISEASVRAAVPSPAPSQAEPDLLDTCQFPTPTSAIRAAQMLSDNSLRYAELAGSVLDGHDLSEHSPWAQLALLHLLAQDHRVQCSPDWVAPLVAQSTMSPIFERLQAPLLVLAARAETEGSPLTVDADCHAPLRQFVAELFVADLVPFAFIFSRLAGHLDETCDRTKSCDETERLLRARCLRPVEESVWSMQCVGGPSLAEATLGLLQELHPPTIVAQPPRRLPCP